MPNTGFKGSVVHVAEASIKGSPAGATVVIRALFCNEEGIVHAQTSHTFSIDEELKEPTAAFIEACKQRIASIHFDQTDSLPTKKVIRGIAEAISGREDTSDEPGSQG